ncbi:MAG: PAS domain-containing protein, partial [Chloroflexota bacterium]
SDIEGKITYVNRACIRLWGGDDKDELIGMPYWIMLKPGEDVRSIAASMFEKKYWEGELVAMRKDGEEVYVYVYAGMVEDEQGKPVQTISSFVDITEQKQTEEEKIRMEQQLQLAGRLAAVGELAAGVAHELNNPIAAVQAFAQFLVERQDIDKQVRSDVETIFKESQRASKITSNLLSFARRHKPQKEMISINEVVEKSLELHAYRLKANNIEVVMELDSNLPRTLADFHQLEQVFVNIITNAEQAMTEAHGKGILCIETLHRGNRVRIIFRDDGPGIAKENLKQLFDPFFTTKAVGKGTGLGLSICFGIIHDHNGYIYADSATGKGATFTVEIPVVSEEKHRSSGPKT